MSAHSSVVGGSTAGLRRKCNASLIEERKSPRTTNVYADRGTALHHVMQVALNENLSFANVMSDFSGVACKNEHMEHVIDLTGELLDAKVRPALDFFDATVPLEAEVLFVELKVSLFNENSVHFVSIPGAFGTADVVFADIATGRAGVIDWKFGDRTIVTAENNDQMRFYLAGAIMCGRLPLQDEYEAWIFQPSTQLDPEKYASKGVYTLEDLQFFVEDLESALSAPVAYVTGEHCARCNGRLTCHAFKGLLTGAIATDVDSLDASVLGSYLDMCESVTAWVRDVKAAALRNAQAGRDVPGWKLMPSQGNRTWKDPDAAVAALGRLGLSVDERIVRTPVSAPVALNRLTKLGTPTKQRERFERTHVIRPDNGERLVKAAPGEETGGALTRLGNAMAARGLN